jgi:hypothetical protein
MRPALLLTLPASLILAACAANPPLPEACFKPTTAEMQAMGWDPKQIIEIELLREARCFAPARAAEAERLRILGESINESSRRLHELNLQRSAPVYQAPAYRPPLNCTSSRIGQQVYTNCY